LGKTKTAIELIIDGTSIDMNVMKEYLHQFKEIIYRASYN